ncbi:MAG: DUF1080 domain-containing protein [Abitibacteriaceae bacterium]|nr:DUF1080 domain-containing protein [Abditibacteriaceae bacterium]
MRDPINNPKVRQCAGVFLIIVVGAIAVRVACAAQEAITDPAQAGADFKVQGEYVGHTTSGQQWGAQVVAVGDGKFDVYFLKGGLPSMGWDGRTRTKVSAALLPTKGLGSVVRVSGAGWAGNIRAGVLSGTMATGQHFKLQHIVRHSSTEGAKPPRGAVILFDGRNTNEWENGQLIEGHFLHWGTTTKKSFRDFRLHLEFRLPFMPKARGQARGNSGVYLQNRYECQVLDSFGLTGEDNECGGFYHQAKPLVNMCYPPLSWQTYDIDFKAARYAASGQKVANARATIWHNGVKIHDNQAFTSQTTGGKLEGPQPGPIHLQNHGNPVVYRNIWVVNKSVSKSR